MRPRAFNLDGCSDDQRGHTEGFSHDHVARARKDVNLKKKEVCAQGMDQP